jgi:uncharacterized protein Usg
MVEAALPIDPAGSILDNLLQIVVVLSWQHYDELKNELPWIEVYIDHWQFTKGRV